MRRGLKPPSGYCQRCKGGFDGLLGFVPQPNLRLSGSPPRGRGGAGGGVTAKTQP